MPGAWRTVPSGCVAAVRKLLWDLGFRVEGPGGLFFLVKGFYLSCHNGDL